jgi:hypothetical protein
LTRTGANAYSQGSPNGVIREVNIDGDLLRMTRPEAGSRSGGRRVADYYVRREPLVEGRPSTLISVPEYGPAGLPADLGRFNVASLTFRYSGLSVERTSNSHFYPGPGNTRDNPSNLRVEVWPPQAGNSDGRLFAASWRQRGSDSLLPYTGRHHGCWTRQGVDVQGVLEVQLDPGANRIEKLRLTYQAVAAPGGTDADCDHWSDEFMLEAADLPYVPKLSTPAMLVFQFPLQPGGETGCSRIRALSGGGRAAEMTPPPSEEWTWRITGFDCRDGPGIIYVALSLPGPAE